MVTLGYSIRRNILNDCGCPANHAVCANAAELMDAGQAADNRVIVNMNVSG